MDDSTSLPTEARSGSPTPGTALALGASAYCWSLLLANTALFYGATRLLTPLLGSRLWGLSMHAWARLNLVAGGFVVTLEGPTPPPGPAVLVANHQSALDVVLLAALVPPPVVFVARHDLFALPVIGGVLRRGGHIAVHQASPEAARAAVDQAVARLASGARVVFFPEGHRSTDGIVRRFRGGAFVAARRAGCPLAPVALAGTRHALAKGSRLIRPCRLAARFLAPLRVDDAATGSAALRSAVEAALAAAVRTLEPGTGPRLVLDGVTLRASESGEPQSASGS